MYNQTAPQCVQFNKLLNICNHTHTVYNCTIFFISINALYDRYLHYLSGTCPMIDCPQPFNLQNYLIILLLLNLILTLSLLIKNVNLKLRAHTSFKATKLLIKSSVIDFHLIKIEKYLLLMVRDQNFGRNFIAFGF